jgi:hypothetical protein
LGTAEGNGRAAARAGATVAARFLINAEISRICSAVASVGRTNETATIAAEYYPSGYRVTRSDSREPMRVRHGENAGFVERGLTVCLRAGKKKPPVCTGG